MLDTDERITIIILALPALNTQHCMAATGHVMLD